MAIREKIVLDTRDYIDGLNEVNRATLKHANKQKNLYKDASRQMQSMEADLKALKVARDNANDPRAIQRYNNAIKSLQSQYDKLDKETKEYKKSLRGLEKESTSSFKKMAGSASLWIKGSLAGAFLYVSSVLRDVTQESIRFDEEINKSLAIQGNVTLEQRNRMVSAAKDVSRELNIATDQVAKGYFFLASAGLDVEQQIANLPVVSKFAKAGMFDLATATDLATDAQSSLRLTTADVIQNQQNLIRVTDVLSKGNSIANATIQQFSESLTNKAGSALFTYNKQIEEGVAVLAAYADQGVKGRLAGERLNILLKRLSESANKNADDFERLNVSVFDSGGSFRNVADIIEDLEGALGGMSDQQKVATLEMLGFTAETQDSILGLIGLSDKIRDYEKNLKEAGGTTQEIADKQLKSLTERFGLLKRRVVDAFGDDTLNLLEKFAGSLEIVADEIDRRSKSNNRKEFISGFSDTLREYQKLRIFAKPIFDREVGITIDSNNEIRLLGEDIEFYNKQIAKSPQLAEAYKRSISGAKQDISEMKSVYEENIRFINSRIEANKGDKEELVELNIQLNENRRRLDEVNKAYDKYVKSRGSSEELDPVIQETQEAVTKFVSDIEKVDLEKVFFSPQMKSSIDKFRKVAPKTFEEMKELMYGVSEEGEDVTNTLEDIADAVSGIINVADAFGKLDDNLAKVLRGGVDVLRNLQNIKDLEGTGTFGLGGTGLAGIAPAIGVGAGVVGIISSLFNSSGASDNSAQIELETTISEQIKAIKDNTRALMQSTVVGGEFTSTEISTIQSMLDNLKKLSEAVIFNGRNDGVADYTQNQFDAIIARTLSRLESEFPDVFEGIKSLYDDLLKDGFSQQEALSKLYNLFGEELEGLIGNFGDYSNTLEGAIQKFNDAISLGLVPLEEAFKTLTDDLKNLGLNLGNDFYRAFITDGDVSGFVEDLIKELASSDTSDERRDAIIAALFNNQESLRGDLTPDEFRELLNFLKGIDPESASDTGGVTRNVAVGSSITEFQSNAVVSLLEGVYNVGERQLETQMQILSALSDQVGGTAPVIAPGSPQGSSNSFNLGGINVSGGISDSDIKMITDEVARELKKAQQRGF